MKRPQIFFQYKYAKQKTIERMIDNMDADGLKQWSFRMVSSGFCGLKFCDPVHGMLDACNAELLYAVEMGLHTYFLEALFGVKKDSAETKRRSKSKKRKLDAAADDNTEKAYQGTAGEGLSTQGIFSPKVKARFDTLAKKYGKLLQHQSERNLPRTYFPQGITSNSLFFAHRKVQITLTSR